MSLALGFYGLTTEVSPGAGTKIASIPITVDSQQAEIQLVALSDGSLPITPTNPLPVEIAQRGESLRLKNINATATPSGVNLISYVVPVDMILSVKKIKVCCRMETKWQLLINSFTEFSGRTGPANPVDTEVLTINYDLPAGTTIELYAESAASQPTTTLEGYLEATIRAV